MTVLFQDCQDLVRRRTAAMWGGGGLGGCPAPSASAFVGQKRRSGLHRPQLNIWDTSWRCPGSACISTECPFPTSTVVPNRWSGGVGTLPPGDSWPCPEAGLVVTALGNLLLASSGWSPRSLLNVLQCIGRPHAENGSPTCQLCRSRVPLLWLEDCDVLAGPSPRDFLLADVSG